METIADIQELDRVADAEVCPSRTRLALHTRLVDYYELTKPRMNFLVVVTTMVGYYMAARGRADWSRIVFTLVGTALTAAGSSVFNQFIEHRLDSKMKRTADRPIPAGRVRPFDAFLFGLA